MQAFRGSPGWANIAARCDKVQHETHKKAPHQIGCEAFSLSVDQGQEAGSGSIPPSDLGFDFGLVFGMAVTEGALP